MAVSTQQQPVLAATSLAVRRGGRPVLTGVDLVVGPGESVAVTGRSGGGKSTLLAVIAGLLMPEGGSVSVGGHRLEGLSERRRAKVRRSLLGIVFQGDELLPELTLAENAALPLLLIGRRTMASCRPEVIELFERLDIADLVGRFPGEVSAGQLQRAAIARAVIHQPRLVLADEPTSALDPATSGEALGLLLELAAAAGAAVVVVTHDRGVAGACARRVELADGRLATAIAPAG